MVDKLFDDSKETFADDFEEIRELGKGSFGVCILCRKKENDAMVAVKRVPKGRLVTDNVQDIIKNEVTVQMAVSGHINIVSVYEVYEDHLYVYIVMEVCEGGDLFDHLVAKGKYSEKDSADLCRSMLVAIEHCHSKGVMHRDVKPENFLFGGDEMAAHIKAADFGLATFIVKGQKLSQSCGSPTYIAPEVIKGSYDEKADIWSIGVVLFIMLCGKMPFYGTNDRMTLRATLRGLYNFKAKSWETISTEAKDVVKKMLTYKPEDRPSAKDLLELPWIKGDASTTPLVQTVMDNVKEFANMNKLKKQAVLIIAEKTGGTDGLEAVRHAFSEVDLDGDGHITVHEMKSALHRVDPSLTEDYLETVWSTYDVDGDGHIDYVEFVTATAQLNKLMTAENLRAAFKAMDSDGSGTLSVKEIAEALHLHNTEEKVVRDIMKEVDTNSDGVIDFSEFEAMMKRADQYEQAADHRKGLIPHDVKPLETEKVQAETPVLATV